MSTHPDTPQLLVAFSVAGKARPKGSLRPLPVRKANGKLGVYMKEESTDGPLWRRHVAKAAAEAIGAAGPNGVTGFPTALPVEVRIRFGFARPSRTVAPAPITRYFGDVDKLVRNVLDALTDAGVYADDSQVTELRASKSFRSVACTEVEVWESW